MKWNIKTLKTHGPKSGLFNQVYDVTKSYFTTMNKPVTYKGKTMPFGDLMKKIYGDKPISIGHEGIGGVRGEPFKNFKIMTQKMNSALGSVMKSIPQKSLRKKMINEIFGDLKSFKGQAWTDEMVNLEVKKAGQTIKGGLTPYKQAAENILAREGETLSKPQFQKLEKILSGWCTKGKQRAQEGGRIGFAGCPDSERITNMKNAAAKLKDPMWRVNNPVAARELAKRIAQSGTALTKLGRFAFGPWTLWGEPLFEAAFVAHDMLGNGTPWKEAVAKSLWAIPAVKAGLLKPSDQQYEEALYQVQGEEGRVRTGVKRFIDNSKKIDELNKLEKMIYSAHIAGKGPLGERTPEARTARVEAAQKRYKDYLESLGGVKGVRDIKNQIEKDREAYDTRVDALKIEREGMTKEKMFIGDQKRMTIERAAEKKQEKGMEDLMYQKYGKVREGDDWIVDPDLKNEWFPEPVLDPSPKGAGKIMRDLLQTPTDESWSPSYPKTLGDIFSTPASRYGWSQMGPIAEAGGVSKMAGGGLANLTRTVAPDSGPMSQGLSYLYNRVKKQ